MNAELPLADTKPIDADKLRTLLRRKYPAKEYAMLYEVRDAAGFEAKRSADVVLIGLWPSRGCLIEGMEIKISRADWLRELRRPEKAEAFVPYCDRWWVIASAPDVVKMEELPPMWGLMVPRGQSLAVIHQAPVLKPKAVDRYLLAAMLKRATDTAADSPEVRATINARIEAQEKEFEDRVRWRTHSLQHDLDELRKAVATFEEASGVKIDRWDGKRVGLAVKAVLAGEHEWRLKELHSMTGRVRNLLQWLEENFPAGAASESAHGNES